MTFRYLAPALLLVGVCGAQTYTMTTYAGNGAAGFAGDGSPAGSSQLKSPQAVAIDSSGSIYIADTGNNRIRKVSGGMINTIAGSANGGYSGDTGTATSAMLLNPS